MLYFTLKNVFSVSDINVAPKTKYYFDISIKDLAFNVDDVSCKLNFEVLWQNPHIELEIMREDVFSFFCSYFSKSNDKNDEFITLTKLKENPIIRISFFDENMATNFKKQLLEININNF